MPIIEADSGLSFAHRQVVTSRNIVGGRWTNWLLGGLNYQIEHHLFPSMPRPNLARAQSIVRAFCLNNGVGYREETLIGSYRQTVHSLRVSVEEKAGRDSVSVAQP
jgi:fatty acid desaturase